MKAAVITVSDRASRGEYQDLSGPEMKDILERLIPNLEVHSEIVPDEKQAILAALEHNSDCDWIFTTGGTDRKSVV